jgi:hypothetical protein
MQQLFFCNYELINHGVLGNYSDVAGPVANETCRLEAVRCHEILFWLIVSFPGRESKGKNIYPADEIGRYISRYEVGRKRKHRDRVLCPSTNVITAFVIGDRYSISRNKSQVF